MAEKLSISVSNSETQIATFEGKQLLEFSVEKTEKKLVGDIYFGLITRVLPGLGAAFVDIGLERSGFLPISEANYSSPKAQPTSRLEEKPEKKMSKMVHEGQKILVQVTKDPIGNKGARLTTRVGLASRYLVLTPGTNALGVSQRIESENERNRLQNLMLELKPALKPSQGSQNTKAPFQRGDILPNSANGFILRTAAMHSSRRELEEDVDFLEKLWKSIIDRSEKQQAPIRIHEDLPLYLRVIRDISIENTESIFVDSIEVYEQITSFAARYARSLTPKISCYDRPFLPFETNSIYQQLGEALKKKVNLGSGAYLVFDQTEAMTTIDVNSGKFVKQETIERTALNTNLEATEAIARHLRLRNIGGIIIIDFIDMSEKTHKERVLEALGRSLESDPMTTTISEVTTLGLVQLTRKRVRESLEQLLCLPCPTCEGTGVVKRVETIGDEILRQIKRKIKRGQDVYVTICATQEVITYLVEKGIPDLEASRYSLKADFQTVNKYKQEEFRLHFG